MTCSFRPIAQFPWPSKDAGLTPLKSLTRGRAIEMKRSRNSHMRSPRRVTLAPTGMPSRILNPAMDFLARLSWAFWPVILARSSIAPSMARLLTTASPTPMLTTIFSRPGIRMGFSIPNLSLRFGATSSMYLSLILAIDILPGLLADPDLLPRVREAVAHLGRLAVGRVDQHHVRGVYRGLEVVEPLLVLLARPRVARAHVDAVYHDPVLPGEDVLDLAAFALLFAGDHHHGVPALYLETHLQHLRGERDDPGVALLPELARHGPEDSRPPRGPVRVDDDPGVLPEADVGTVVAARLLLGPHHDGAHYLALLDRAARGGLLDGSHNDVTDARRAPLASAERADGQDAPRPRVVRDPQPRFLLYHLLGPRYHVGEAPALSRGERPGLDDPDRVTHPRLVGLVVHDELLGTAHPLLVHGVPDERLDRDGLVGLVRDDEPDPLLAPVALGVGLNLALVLVERGALGRTDVEAGLDGLSGFPGLDKVLRRLGRGLLLRLRGLVFLFLYHY